MKILNKTIFALTIVALCACSNAKKEQPSIAVTEVPEAVMSSFNSRFITGTDIKWTKDSANYAVNFTQGESVFDATFLPNGELIEVEAEMKVEMIPNTMANFILIKYPEAKITEIDRVMTKDGNFYEVEIETDGKKTELLFDTQENFMREKK